MKSSRFGKTTAVSCRQSLRLIETVDELVTIVERAVSPRASQAKPVTRGLDIVRCIERSSPVTKPIAVLKKGHSADGDDSIRRARGAT